MYFRHSQNPGKRGRDLSRTIPVLAGPTGAGKTSLISSLNPERFEIVSLDSRQIYKYLPIGTAAPEPEVLQKIRHHLVGFLNPDRSFTAMEFRELALQSIEDIISRDRIPLLVGGAGFYLQLLKTGPFEFEENPEVREEVLAMEHEDRLALLREKDPDCIVKPGESPGEGRIHPNDAYRVERYLSMVLSSGQTMKELWAGKKDGAVPDYDFEGLFLFPGEETLWTNLKIRARKMIQDGLLEEADGCRNQFGSDCPGLKILGYSEALQCIDGTLNEKELQEKLWIVHRQYARRQRIWFQKRQYVQLVDSLSAEALERTAVNLFSGLGINH